MKNDAKNYILNNQTETENYINKELNEKSIKDTLEDSDAQLVALINYWEGASMAPVCTTSEGKSGYKAYVLEADPDGVISIGVGLTNSVTELKNIKVGECYTKEYIDSLKIKTILDLKEKVKKKLSNYQITDFSNEQINALTSLGFNAGFGKSSQAIDAYIDNENNPNALINYMKKIIYADGKVLCNLVKRRDYEIELFTTGIYSSDFQRRDLSYYYKKDNLPDKCNFGYSS